MPTAPYWWSASSAAPEGLSHRSHFTQQPWKADFANFALDEFLILSQWADPAESERNVEWTRSLFEAMETIFEEGVYVIKLGDEGEDRVMAAYGANYGRLLALKGKYDPTNLFRLIQNIAPPTEAAREPVK